MTSEQRRSIDNGIWMCYTHGKLIDTDFAKYSVDTLKKWRAVAERKAELRQVHGENYKVLPSMLYDLGLPSDGLILHGLGTENYEIGTFLEAAMVSELWGSRIALAIQDECIELARNAFKYGGAKEFELTVQQNSILLTDDGSDFDVWRLYNMQKMSGGVIATKHLIDCLKDRLLVVARRIGGKNETLFTYVNESDDVFNVTPCSVEVSWRSIRNCDISCQVDGACRSICIVLPPYMSISDAVHLEESTPMVISETRPIVFVLSKTSPKAVEILKAKFPNCHILGS